MPVTLRVPIRRISQQEFGDMSYEVMRHVFEMHREMGRFFKEGIYKQELAYRMPNVKLEEPVDVTFDSFRTTYFLDVLVGDGGFFEFKAAEALAAKHRAQLLNYLLLCEASHGKLINVRPESVEHEFVNTHWRLADRIKFGADISRWTRVVTGATQLQNCLMSMLQDLGAGLEISLYEEAITHFFGGVSHVEQDVDVIVNGRKVGVQRFRLIAPGVAFKITGLDGRIDSFEDHLRRLLAHADLQAIAWINVSIKKVTFTMLTK